MSKLERLSNIESLRIVAMFLVLVVHSDFFSLGAPTQEEIHIFPIQSYTRVFLESISIVCVNVFVMISGWFGIHPSFQNIVSFLYQILFFILGIYFITILIGTEVLSVVGLKYCFLLQPWNWFIKAYILLLILSPILNLFVCNVKKETAKMILVFFFIFQTLYGWYFYAVKWFEGGYSTISFIGLYLLMQYKHKYYGNNRISSYVYLLYFIIATLLLTFLYIVFESKRDIIFMYNNPIIIAASYLLFMTFEGIAFKNKLINYIAISCFSVFLLHTNPFLCKKYFVPFIQNIYYEYSGIECIALIFVFLIFVFGLAVMIDQIRIFSFNKVVWPLFVRYAKSHK